MQSRAAKILEEKKAAAERERQQQLEREKQKNAELSSSAAAGAGAGASEDMYIQLFVTEGFSISVDYRPKHLDFNSLRQGDFVQAVHLFPLCGVTFSFKGLRFAGVHGWDRCAALLLQCHLCSLLTV